MKTLVAFRCLDGSYLLAPSTASLAWFENPSVEFLGDVRADSFEQAVTIAREIAKWNFALISKNEFYLSWAQTQKPLLAAA
jgi:hypothetical protein